MGVHRDQLPADVLAALAQGVVIPAHPLVLDAQRNMDVRRQKALTRYYIDAGAGGVAVGVHTTQFGIRAAGLYTRVLETVSDAIDEWTTRPIVKIAGVTGGTSQAITEARAAADIGYHAALLNVGSFKGSPEAAIVEHCGRVADEMPLVGFYLLPACGGVVLSESFWRQFCALDNVVAVKIAPFNRYHTIDVVRGLVAARAEKRIALYTGNDDHIVGDLLTPFSAARGGERITVRIKGGLLGHWAVWTQKAVELLGRVHAAVDGGRIDLDLLALDAAVTDCNRAIYDAAHDLKGSIAGVHEVLRRQGLMEGLWCLDPEEALSPGQREAIDAVYRNYPEMNDDAFVKANLHRWLDADATPKAA